MKKKDPKVPRAPTRLLAMERRLLNTLESMTDGFVSLDKKWHYIYVNKRAAEMLGKSQEELKGKHIWTVFPEGVGQPFYYNYLKAAAEQKAIIMEEYYEPWKRWFENRIYPTADGLSIFFQEITERKRSEQLISGQNELLELVVAGRPLPEILNALIRFVESQARDLIGSILLMDEDGLHVHHGAAPNLPREYIVAIDGSPIGPTAGSCGTAVYRKEAVFVEDIASDPLWDDYRELALPLGLRACWSTPIFDEDHHVLGTFALYYRRPGLPTELHMQLIDIATNIASISISNARDEEALHRNEQRLGLIFDTVADVIFLLEVCPENRYKFISVNHAFLQTTGLSSDQIIGRFVDDVIPASSLDLVIGNYRKAIQEKIPVQWEEVSEFPAGTRIAIVKVSPVFDARGICINLVGSVHDITQFREAEEQARKSEEARKKLQEQVFQAQKLELIGGLAAGVAHQLNTPLAVIMMRLQMLEEDLASVADPTSIAQLQGIMASAKKMSVIIQDLLNFSRLPKLHKENFQIATVLRQILNFVEVRARKQNVLVVSEFAADIPAMFGDTNRLEQAFLNIVVNALDVMPEGGTISVATSCSSTHAVVRIRDTGPGIGPEVVDRLFDPFFTTKPVGQGTGLGLPVTQEIIWNHGGEIRVEGKKGEGTLFEILLPLREVL